VIRVLLKRELRLAISSGGGAALGIGFFLVVVLLLPLGIGPDQTILAKVAPGGLWVAAMLAALLSLDRLFQADAEDGSLDILLCGPLSPEAIVATKALAHWLTTGLPLAAIAPLLGVTLNLPAPAYGWLLISLLVGTPALSFLGAFGAALTVGVRRGGLLLSLLVLPLAMPTLVLGAKVASDATRGFDPGTSLVLLSALTLAIIGMMPFATAFALRAARG